MWGGDEGRGRVGRRASLDQYSTHIASGGGEGGLEGIASQAKGERWRPREAHTEARTDSLSSLFYIYSPFFVLVKGPFLALYEMPA